MSQLTSRQLIGANFSFQHFPFEKVAEVLRDFGFKEIELWGITPHLDLFHGDDSRVKQVREILVEHGLSTWCYTPEQVIYPINIAAGDPVLRQKSIDLFYRAADIAADLGAKYLFLTSGRGFETDCIEKAWEHSAHAIGQIADHARRNGLRCLLEPLQRVETNLITDARGLERMLNEVSRGNIDVVLDTVGMATAGDTVSDYFEKFGDRLAHIQLVDGTPNGHLVWGDGNLPLGDYVTEIASFGYKGKISFEPFGNGSYALDPVTALSRNLQAISPYLYDCAVSA
ncbi:sugar phosphate isomerase/epimerase [Thalassospira sp. NFXS8]|uniref:sugar phosphate isomerase/epimerase family protein n=1 Tax=Thalassospira sp. NFXS8 TaxID=2819093 RepID=UPI0032DF789C